MPDGQPDRMTAAERDARDLTDPVDDLGEDLLTLTGDEVPDALDVGDLDDLVAATSPDADYAPFDETDETHDTGENDDTDQADDADGEVTT